MIGWKNFRKSTGGISEIQAEIIDLRYRTPEKSLIRQKDYATALKRPLSTINYNILQLKKKEYMDALNYLTPAGKVVYQELNRYVNNTKKLRAHKMFATLHLAGAYHRFEEMRGKFERISPNWRHRGFKFKFKECIILFYSPTKICFYIPDIYGDSIDEIYAIAYDEYVGPLQEHLEKAFDVKIDRWERGAVQINHLAFQNHPLANIFKEHNVQYKSDRIEIDHSHGIPELETVHKKTAVQDMDKILDYEKIIRNEKPDVPLQNLENKDKSSDS